MRAVRVDQSNEVLGCETKSDCFNIKKSFD